MKTPTPLSLARMAGRLALEKKGFDIKILKLKSLSSVCDFFVIASGSADVHVKAIARSIHDGLASKGIKPIHREGMNSGRWILLDYADVVIHIFLEPIRQFYALEKL